MIKNKKTPQDVRNQGECVKWPMKVFDYEYVEKMFFDVKCYFDISQGL